MGGRQQNNLTAPNLEVYIEKPPSEPPLTPPNAPETHPTAVGHQGLHCNGKFLVRYVR